MPEPEVLVAVLRREDFLVVVLLEDRLLVVFWAGCPMEGFLVVP